MKKSNFRILLAASALTVAGGTVWAVGSYPLDIPSAKVKILEQQQTDLAASPSHRLPKTPPASSSATNLPKTLGSGSGIIHTDQGPFSPTEFIVNSEWSGVEGNRMLMVFGGNLGDINGGPALGGVRVYFYTLADLQTGKTEYLGQFLTSFAEPLSITSISGQNLVLNSLSGKSYNFDLSTLKLSAN